MCIFISLPIAEKLYKWLSPRIGKGNAIIGNDSGSDEIKEYNDDSSDGLSLGKLERWSVMLLAFSIIVTVGRIFPVSIPSIIYISLIGLILAIPGMPTSEFVTHYASQVELTTICTAFLAYVGIAIGKDWDEFKRIGWRGLIVALIVISGTYLCSATIANITLFVTGMI